MSLPVFRTHRESEVLLIVEVGGRIDALTMETGLETFWQASKGMLHANLLMWDRGYDWPTLGAIGVELRHWWMTFELLQRIDRVALLSDDDFLRHAAMIESMLIPGLSIRNFTTSQEACARDWLAQGITAAA